MDVICFCNSFAYNLIKVLTNQQKNAFSLLLRHFVVSEIFYHPTVEEDDAHSIFLFTINLRISITFIQYGNACNQIISRLSERLLLDIRIMVVLNQNKLGRLYETNRSVYYEIRGGYGTENDMQFFVFLPYVCCCYF